MFAIGQLLGEIPYSILCGTVYWTLMVWPMNFGQGAAGKGGNAFQLLMVIFMELFGGKSRIPYVRVASHEWSVM